MQLGWGLCDCGRLAVMEGKKARGAGGGGAARNHHPEAPPPFTPSCSHVTSVVLRPSGGLPLKLILTQCPRRTPPSSGVLQTILGSPSAPFLPSPGTRRAALLAGTVWMPFPPPPEPQFSHR